MKYQGQTRRANRRAAQVGALGRRSLELLHTIDATVDRLMVDEEFIATISRMAHELSSSLRKQPPGLAIDNDGELASLFRQCLDLAAQKYEVALRCRQAALADERLQEEGGVVDAYDSFCSAIADMHDSLADLAESIAELDADLDPGPESGFTNASDLMKALLQP